MSTAVAFGATINVDGLYHSYGSGAHGVEVLRGLDLEVTSGGYVALEGRTGAGKTTLLALLGGLERPTGGTVQVDDFDLSSLRGRRLASYRRTIVGFVFQHFGLVEVLTARENVLLALSLARVPRADRTRRADDLLEAVGLTPRAHHRPTRLSGGERQSVAIARALANRPRLLLADEPTGNLDGESAERVLTLLERLRTERGCTLVVVTHNPLVACRADVRLLLADGVLRERRHPE